uniref:G-protein coupled receptors family 1 profile domain-containing protein n=1 Tax=Biomphalaria glabrata TaxID=6526 RepID=A0A2C9KBR4_BIOGL
MDEFTISKMEDFVIAITLTLFCNSILIRTILEKPKFYQSPKDMMFISLAIGDIVQSHAPVVIILRNRFLYNSRPGTFDEIMFCKACILYLVHFLYGVGLFFIGLDMLLMRLYKVTARGCPYAVMMSTLPWVMCAIVVYPLVMARMDYENNMSRDTVFIITTLSVFLPLALALSVSLVIFTLSVIFQHSKSHGTYGEIYDPKSWDLKVHLISGPDTDIKKQTGVFIDPSEYNDQTSTNSDCLHNSSTRFWVCSDLLTTSVYQNDQISQWGFQSINYCNKTNIDCDQVLTIDIRSGSVMLLLLSVVFALLVLPNHVFVLVETMEHSTTAFVVLIHCLRWIMFSRTFIHPCIVVCLSKLYGV